jgi:hypothetical protein
MIGTIMALERRNEQVTGKYSAWLGYGPLQWQEGALPRGLQRKGDSIEGPAQNTPYSDGYPVDVTTDTMGLRILSQNHAF